MNHPIIMRTYEIVRPLAPPIVTCCEHQDLRLVYDRGSWWTDASLVPHERRHKADERWRCTHCQRAFHPREGALSLPVGSTSEMYPRHLMRFGEVTITFGEKSRHDVWWPISKNAASVTTEDFERVCAAARETIGRPYSARLSEWSWADKGLEEWRAGRLRW